MVMEDLARYSRQNLGSVTVTKDQYGNPVIQSGSVRHTTKDRELVTISSGNRITSSVPFSYVLGTVQQAQSPPPPEPQADPNQAAVSYYQDRDLYYPKNEFTPIPEEEKKVKPSIWSRFKSEVTRRYSWFDKTFFSGALIGGANVLDVAAERAGAVLSFPSRVSSIYATQKAADLQKRIPAEIEISEQTMLLEEQKRLQDLYKQSWYENLGLFRSQEEKTLQDLLRQKSFYQSIVPETQATLPLYDAYQQTIPFTESILADQSLGRDKLSFGEAAATGVKWGIPILLGAVGIALILKNKKRRKR